VKRLKVGIIGQGRSGRDIHGNSLSRLKDKYEIVAVSDLLDDRLLRAKQEFRCDTYKDYKDLIKRNDLDLIINASPSHLHVSITLECLNQGHNVLCEKPLARKAEEVDLLIETSRKTGNLLAVFQQSRYAPAFLQLKEVIDSGVLGRIVQVSIAYNGFARRWDWQTLQEYNGGNLLNTGSHPLDQALQLFGTDMMPEITCRMDRTNTSGDAEDYVKLMLYGNNHPTIDLEISSCCAYPSFTYNVQGTLGGLKGSTSHLDWKYFKPEEAPDQPLVRDPLHKQDGTPAYCREELKWYEHSWDIPEDQRKDTFNTMAKSFYVMLYNSLVTGSLLEITVEEVRQQIAVIEECHQQNKLALANTR
jgi:scyllo-inositol 2-dehydrogenase (NADP+)